MLRICCCIALFTSLIACKNSKEKNSFTDQIVKSDTLDFVKLKQDGFLDNTQVVNIAKDPVYQKVKSYNAIALKPLMMKYLLLDSVDISETKVVFECEDGYKPEMPLQKLFSAKSYVAVSDRDAPKGKDWEQIIKDGHEMKAEPFYVVYEDVSDKDYSFKWPYNVVKLYLAPLHENDADLIPKDSKYMVGYKLFDRSCKICHAINQIGGQMGPELIKPKSITQYWKREDLIAFIENPASYRLNVKMPKPNITTKESEAIVDYLEYMAAIKNN